MAKNRSLRESEERFHLMVQAGQDYAIFMFDAEERESEPRRVS